MIYKLTLSKNALRSYPKVFYFNYITDYFAIKADPVILCSDSAFFFVMSLL